VSKRVFSCTLGTFSVKESLRVLWARFVRFVRFVRCENGVFTGALSDELGWKHSGLKSGHTQGRAYDGFSIIILLYGWFWLLSWSVLRGRALVGGGSMWWGFYPY
jgi:hypothetical protein